MSVEKEEISEMAKIIAILNKHLDDDTVSEDIEPTGQEYNDFMDMNRIMKIIDETSKMSMEQLEQKSKTDRELKQAIYTEKTDHGVRIGKYDIVVLNDVLPHSYDVVDSESGLVIEDELNLYETARAITFLKNNNKDNTPLYNEFILNDTNYGSNLSDAIFFKHRWKMLESQKNYDRASIMEDRYYESKNKALLSKDRINKLISNNL